MTEKAPKSNLPVNEKQLITGIKKDAVLFFDCASKTINYAISIGEKLIKLKEITPHGQWENRVKNDFQVVFGVRHAQRFMAIAEDKYLALEINRDCPLTIENTLKAISSATPEQIEQARQLELQEQAKAAEAQAAKAAKAIPAPKPAPDIIEGEFTEVKPEPVAKPARAPEPEAIEEDPIELLQETITQLQAVVKEVQDDNNSMVRVFESNDRVTQALDEVKRVNEKNRVLTERINGLQNQNNELIRSVKYWKGRFEKLEKANDK